MSNIIEVDFTQAVDIELFEEQNKIDEFKMRQSALLKIIKELDGLNCVDRATLSYIEAAYLGVE